MDTQYTNREERVLAYLRMEMSEAEQALFESDLLRDSELNSEYELMRHIKAGLYHTQKAENEETKQKVAKMWENAQSQNRRKRIIKWALLVIFFVFISIWGILKYTQNNPQTSVNNTILPSDTKIADVSTIENSPISQKDTNQTVSIKKPKPVQNLELVAAFDSLNKQKKRIIALAQNGADWNRILNEKQDSVKKCRTNNLADVRPIRYDFSYPIWVNNTDTISANQSVAKQQQKIIEKQQILVKLSSQFANSLTQLKNEVRIWAKDIKKYCK